jgi:hypothetical protein
VVIWYIPPAFGMLKQEKSGNPEWNTLLWWKMSSVKSVGILLLLSTLKTVTDSKTYYGENDNTERGPWQRKMIVQYSVEQGCQMAYFQTKTSNLGRFCRVLQWKMYIGIFYAHLEYNTGIWYISW